MPRGSKARYCAFRWPKQSTIIVFASLFICGKYGKVLIKTRRAVGINFHETIIQRSFNCRHEFPVVHNETLAHRLLSYSTSEFFAAKSCANNFSETKIMQPMRHLAADRKSNLSQQKRKVISKWFKRNTISKVTNKHSANI